ncbi:MAG: right-handed parallel beta-helix repeat-containing protein [Opitutales bacterium]
MIYGAYGLLSVVSAAKYYVDSDEGRDDADGLSERSAWRSLARASENTYQSGDRLLLRSNCSWEGALLLKGSGKPGSPILLSRYGEGALPIINGDGKSNANAVGGKPISCAIRLFNQEHWRIENLEITNYDLEEESGLSLEQWEARNLTKFANVEQPERVTGRRSRKVGILVQAKGLIRGDFLSGLRFSGLKIHGINGDMGTKDNGGIFFKVYDDGLGNTVHFEDVLFEDNLIFDVDRTGISNVSEFDDREFSRNINWNPNRNWVFRNNVFRRTGANALIVRVAVAPLMEKNLFDTCAIKGSGNAAFNFNTDDALWQFNEFRFTKANWDDEDAGGVDSDYRSKNTIIQHNHIHDNDFGLLVTGGPGRFNDGTIVRNNLIVNDGRVARKGDDGKFVLRVSGSATNTLFYKNVVILDEDQSYTKIAFHKRWGTLPESTTYRENVFVNLAKDSFHDLGESTGNIFVDNQYFGEVLDETNSKD